jgi:hypothetical protein
MTAKSAIEQEVNKEKDLETKATTVVNNAKKEKETKAKLE